jgi:aryl-alcohol dehydrogenase-like predicted oxidoreductase
METVVEGFQKLQAVGKIRSYGVSTSNFEYLKAFNQDNQAATLQIDYSILHRTPEKEIFQYCQEKELGILVRGPLAMGILTGKFTAETKFPRGDFRRRWHENADEYRIFLEDLKKVEQLRLIAKDRTLAQLALQFAFAHAGVTCVIPGAKNEKQLRENLAAAVLPPLSPSERAQIDQITPKGGGRKIWPA